MGGRIEMGVSEATGEGHGLGVGGWTLGAGGWQAERVRESKTRAIGARVLSRRSIATIIQRMAVSEWRSGDRAIRRLGDQ